MKYIASIALAVMVCCLGIRTADAGSVEYTTQGQKLFSLIAPEGWEVAPGFEVAPADMPDGSTPMPRILSLKSPETEQILWVGFWSPTSLNSVADSSAYVEGLLADFLEGAELTDIDDRVYGGRLGKLFNGIGTKLGRPVDFAIAVVPATADRIMIGAFVAEPAAFDRHEEAMKKTMESVSFAGGTQ